MSKPFIPPGQRPSRFNLSRWAIQHGSLTRFLVVLILAAGGLSLISMGQKEDPAFTFRVMVIQVVWPGASTHEMQAQVVDKIEKVKTTTRAPFQDVPVEAVVIKKATLLP